MTPKKKNSYAGGSGSSKRLYKVLPLSDKVKVKDTLKEIDTTFI
jgi:hypothetical protein